jgi:hypothetical protein
MSITVQPGDNAYWGPKAQAVSPSYSAVAAEESPDKASWLETLRFWPARGFQLTHIRLVRRLPDL